MSDTPRTDAAPRCGEDAVDIDFARQLERELAACKENLRVAVALAEDLNTLPSATATIPAGYRLVCKECGSIPGDVCLAPSRCPTEKRNK